MKFKLSIPPQVKAVLAKLKPIGRHHYFIYSFVLLCGLTYAVYVVNTTLSAGGDDDYRTQQEHDRLKGTFDQATIKKIEELNKSNESSNAPPPPSGVRTNPFAE